MTDQQSSTVQLQGVGIDFHGGGCGATILVGNDERQETLRPQGAATVAEYREDSPLGPLQVRKLSWPLPGGVTLTWRVGLCERRSGFTVQAAVYNGANAPFRDRAAAGRALCRSRNRLLPLARRRAWRPHAPRAGDRLVQLV